MRQTVSIIIPTWNSDKTLHRCLTSVLEQSFKDFEVVVVDGQSTDSTLEIIKELSRNDSRIAWASEKDKGVYDAMNKGIKRAKGEWLYFLGSDDNLYDLNVFAQIFRARPEIKSDVLYGNVRIINDATWAEDGEIYAGAFTFQKLLSANICHQSIFYRTAFVRQKIGEFNVDYSVCADWDFNLRCWAKTAFEFNDLIIADFHGGGFSTTTTTDVPFKNDFLENLLHYFNLSLYAPEINNPAFRFYQEVLKKQKQQNRFRYFLSRLLYRFK